MRWILCVMVLAMLVTGKHERIAYSVFADALAEEVQSNIQKNIEYAATLPKPTR